MKKPEKRQKWRHDNLPQGFPTRCSGDELRDVIQDLYEEFSIKTKEGKINVIWESLVTKSIEAARSELQHRIAYLAFWATVVGLLISLLAIGISISALSGSPT